MEFSFQFFVQRIKDLRYVTFAIGLHCIFFSSFFLITVYLYYTL